MEKIREKILNGQTLPEFLENEEDKANKKRTKEFKKFFISHNDKMNEQIVLNN